MITEYEQPSLWAGNEQEEALDHIQEKFDRHAVWLDVGKKYAQQVERKVIERKVAAENARKAAWDAYEQAERLLDAAEDAESYRAGREAFEAAALAIGEANHRTYDEVGEAAGEMFDRVWYDRHMSHSHGDGSDCPSGRLGCEPAERLRQQYGADNLGPYDTFEWGMINGKLSALRWIQTGEWDFLDT